MCIRLIPLLGLVLGWLPLLPRLLHMVELRLLISYLLFFKWFIISNACSFYINLSVYYSIGAFYSSVIVTMRKYIASNGGFRYVSVKHYFDESSRGSLPDVLATSYLERSVKGRVVIVSCVRSLSVSYSTEQFVVILSKCVG